MWQSAILRAKTCWREGQREDTIITWRLCAAVYRGCGSCGNWAPSFCAQARRASLSPPFSVPWRCTVATLTAGAAPVTKDTEWWAVIVKSVELCSQRGRNGRPSKGSLRRRHVDTVDHVSCICLLAVNSDHLLILLLLGFRQVND